MRFLFTCGGTAGHINPALGVAGRIRELMPDAEFLFIGANIDAVETAAKYGIDSNRAVNYNADKEGTKILFKSVSKAVCSMRQSEELSTDWREEIDRDFKKRGRNIK